MPLWPEWAYAFLPRQVLARDGDVARSVRIIQSAFRRSLLAREGRGGGASATLYSPSSSVLPPPTSPSAALTLTASAAPEILRDLTYRSVCSLLFGFSLRHGKTTLLLVTSIRAPYPAQPISETREKSDKGPHSTACRGISEELFGLHEGSKAAFDCTARLLSYIHNANYFLQHLGANPTSTHLSHAIHADVLFTDGIDGAHGNFRVNDEIGGVIMVPLDGLTGHKGEVRLLDVDGRLHDLRDGRHLGTNRLNWIRGFMNSLLSSTLTTSPSSPVALITQRRSSAPRYTMGPKHPKSNSKPKDVSFPVFPAISPHDLSQRDQLSPDFLSLQLAPSPARDHNKPRTRVAFILTDRENILCLRIDGLLHLPATTVPVHLRSRPRPRSVATNVFRGFFGQPSPRLDALIQTSARRYGRGETMYFIVVIPSGFPPILDELPSESPLASISLGVVEPFWFPVNEAHGLSLFFHPDDTAFHGQVLRSLNGRTTAKLLVSVFALRATSHLTLASPLGSHLDVPVLPCTDPTTTLPSYHSSERVAFDTLSFLNTVLLEPGNPRIIALDLEGQLSIKGSIELLQICVCSTTRLNSTGDGTNYTHVFDIRRIPTLLLRHDSLLVLWLTDPTITKLIHAGRGDGLTLFGRYGITPRGFFDTGIADALVVGRHPFSARGLGTVLRSYITKDLDLDHKGVLQHEFDTWTKRPITIRLFQYAYQDVSNCIQLYYALLDRMSLLCPLNPRCLVELAFAITAASQPPFSLPPLHPSCSYPPMTVFVVHDGSFFLTLRTAHDSPRFPTFDLLPFTSDSEPTNPSLYYRHHASSCWRSFFGPATSSGRFSTALHKMRKPLVLPLAFIYEVEVASLSPVIGGLTSGLPATFPPEISFDFCSMTVDFDSVSSYFSDSRTDAICLQYLQHLRAFTSRPRMSSESFVDALAYTVDTPLPPLAFAAAPTSTTPPRIHLLLHDGTYCLIFRVKATSRAGPGFTYSFPFLRMPPDTTDRRHTAFHALETMLGPLSRYSSLLGQSIKATTFKGRLLDSPADNPVYECFLDRSVFPLQDHISSFTVAWHNRRITATLASTVFDWKVVRLAEAVTLLPKPFTQTIVCSQSPPTPPTFPTFATCCLHLLVLIDTISGPTLVMPLLPDGTVNFDSFCVSSPNSAPIYPKSLLDALQEQMSPSSAVNMAVKHTLAAQPDGSVSYDDTGCLRVWCIHLNINASKTVASLPGSPPLANIRLRDFLARDPLPSERSIYLGCCEMAVNTAIRIAYPRVIPSIPLLPARKDRPDSFMAFPPAAELHKAPPPPSLPPPGLQPHTAGLHKAVPAAFPSFDGPCSLHPRDCPPSWLIYSHSFGPETVDSLGFACFVSPIPSELVTRLFISLVKCLSPNTASSCRHIVSNGMLCSAVALAMSNACPGPVPGSYFTAATEAFDPDADDQQEEGGIVPDSGFNDDGQFGTHKGFHNRYRRPGAGSDFLPLPPTLDEIIIEQRRCEEYHQIYSYLDDGPAYLLASRDEDPTILGIAMRKVSQGYRLVDGVLVYLNLATDPHSPHRIVLPLHFRSWALHTYHDLHGHQGVQRTDGLISRLYYWPRLATDVADHVRQCDICARSKVSRVTAGAFHLSGDGDYPWDVVTVDLYTVGFCDDGYDHVLVFADQFSRGVVTLATKGTPNSKEVLAMYFNYVAKYKGFARRIRNDRGSIFISALIKEAYASLRITLEASTAGHHETVGLAERFNSVLHSLLLTHRVSTADPRWTRYLAHLEIAYNAAIHSRTGFSPFYVQHGRDFPLSLDVAFRRPGSSPPHIHPYVAAFIDRLQACWKLVRRRLLLHALSSKRTQDTKHDTKIKFLPGQRVLVVKEKGGQFGGQAVTKWHEPTHGPYRVVEALDHDNYKLTGLPSRRFHDVFHISRLAPYPLVTHEGDAPLPDGDYYVDSIIDRRLHLGSPPSELGSYEFLVRWLGYSPAHDTWETVSTLANAMDEVNIYNALYPIPLEDPALEAEDLSAFDSTLPDSSQFRSFRSRPDPLDLPDETVLSVPLASPDSIPSDAATAAPPGSVEVPIPDILSVPDTHDGSDHDPIHAPTEWLCTSCNAQNQGRTHCHECKLSRSLFGADFTTGRPSRNRAPAPTTTASLSAAQLERIYTRPFRHPLGPIRFRVNPSYKDTRRSTPRTEIEFQLSRSGDWVWVWPGRQGERLSIDEFNRVRAFRIDHPEACPDNNRGQAPPV